MKLYAPEFSGMHVWQVGDAKSSKTTYTASRSNSPPPNVTYGHPVGRYDSEGLFWTFIPMTGDEDPNSPLSSRFQKHPHADREYMEALKGKQQSRLDSFGSYKETEF